MQLAKSLPPEQSTCLERRNSICYRTSRKEIGELEGQVGFAPTTPGLESAILPTSQQLKLPQLGSQLVCQ
jgi:hypothetical protein